jgi:putative flippase GtrA
MTKHFLTEEHTDPPMTETSDTLSVPPTQTGSLITRARALLRHKEMQRFLKFAVVGAIGAVVDFGTFNLLLWMGWLEGAVLRLPFGLAVSETGIAGATSFFMAIISNFLWNRYWTYPDSRSKPIVTQFIMFLGINVAGLLIRIPVLELLSGPLGRLVSRIVPALAAGTVASLGKNAALALAVIIVMFWNFFVNRYLTYNDVD